MTWKWLLTFGAVVYALPRAFAAPGSDEKRPPTTKEDVSVMAAAERGRGRGADSPNEIPPRGWADILRRTWTEINGDRVLAVAAGVAFYGILALFPAITASVSLYGLFLDPASISAEASGLSGILPGEAVGIVNDQIKRIAAAPNSTLGLAFFFSLGFALWSATGGTKALMEALNVAHGETEKRSFFTYNAFALAATFGGIFMLILLVTVVAVIPAVLGLFFLGPVAEWLLWAGRWPTIFLILLGGLAIVYRYGPSRENAKWRWITPGSLAAAAGLVLFSMLFSWYAANFANFNQTYGSLGAVIAFMTWLWLASVIVLAGAELNAECERQTFKDSTGGATKPLGARGAFAADTVGPASAA